ncbi:hypothetical protein Q8F55_007237 [Vanrija albida]|uniref:Uncharacterized protein n=1 Tax=Vanrija albida TaxID=181172 RepID=A0ABR3PZK8_9TREE
MAISASQSSAGHSTQTSLTQVVATERPKSIRNRLDWRRNTYYERDTTVYYRDLAFVCRFGHQSVDPPTPGELWRLWVRPSLSMPDPVIVTYEPVSKKDDFVEWKTGVHYLNDTVVWFHGQPTPNSIDSKSSRRKSYAEQRSPDGPSFSPRHTPSPFSPETRSLAGADDTYDDAPNAFSYSFPRYPENVDYAALTTIDEHAAFTNFTGYIHNTVVWQSGIAWKCLESHVAREAPREGRFWTRVGSDHTQEPSLPSLYGVTLPGFHGHQDGRVIHVYHHFIPAPAPGFTHPTASADAHSTVIAWEGITTVESETQWKLNASYQVDSVVWYLGEAWKYVAAHTSAAPPYTGAYWVKIEVKGKAKGKAKEEGCRCGCGLPDAASAYRW